MARGHGTYDPKVLSRQLQNGSSDGLSELGALWSMELLDHVKKIIEKQEDPQPLHSHWISDRGKQLQDSSRHLFVWKRSSHYLHRGFQNNCFTPPARRNHFPWLKQPNLENRDSYAPLPKHHPSSPVSWKRVAQATSSGRGTLMRSWNVLLF